MCTAASAKCVIKAMWKLSWRLGAKWRWEIFINIVFLTSLVVFWVCQSPQKAIWGKDIEGFAQGAKHCPSNHSDITDQLCSKADKWLLSRCFQPSQSLWFPGSLSSEECLSFVWNRTMIKSHLRIAFVGDSRVRQLFTSFATLFQGNESSLVERFSDGIGSEKLATLKLPNWAAERGLQHNYRSRGLTEDGVRYDLTFWWDPLFDLADDVLLDELATLNPQLIVVSAGLWFVVQKRPFEEFESSLNRRLSSFSRFSSQFKIIFYDNFEALNYNSGRISPVDIWELQETTGLVVKRHSDVLLMDSHLNLCSNYIGFCHKYNIETEDKQWKCHETNHMGFIVIDHAAKLILMFLKAFLSL